MTTQAPLFSGAEPEIGVATLRKRLGTLLDRIGTPGTCDGCRASIVWVQYKTGACPIDVTGLNFGDSHFKTCPERARFQRK